jgi:TRAP-type uncharacterized transport system fused permease subunit
MKIGWTAVGLTISAYVVPFAFVYNTAMLGSAPIFDILKVSITAIMGVTAVAAAWTNFLVAPLGLIQRLLFATGGVFVIIPEGMTDIYGMGCLAAGIVLHLLTVRLSKRKAKIQLGA